MYPYLTYTQYADSDEWTFWVEDPENPKKYITLEAWLAGNKLMIHDQGEKNAGKLSSNNIKQAFSDLGVDKIPTIKQLNEEYGELLAQKKEAYKHYREAKQEMTDFATAKYDIERFLNLSQEESQHQGQEKEKQKKQNKSR